MKVEYQGGPLDGEVAEIPEGTKIWIVQVPRQDMKRMMKYSDADIPTAEVPLDDHAYGLALPPRLARSGAVAFMYIGERMRK